MRRCHKANFSVACLPLAAVQRESDDAVLDSTDAEWERLVISIYGRAFFASVKVFLNPFDILAGLLISLAVTYKVVIFKTGRTRSIAIS